VSDGRRASKTDVTILSWHTSHNASLAPWSSTPSLQRSISLALPRTPLTETHPPPPPPSRILQGWACSGSCR